MNASDSLIGTEATSNATPVHSRERASHIASTDLGDRLWTASPEDRLLLQAVRAGVLKICLKYEEREAIDWDAFTDTALDNRLLLLAARGLAGNSKLPETFVSAVERYKALTLRLNGANLVALRKIVSTLSQSGIDVVALKGPSALFALYGDYFIKPSTDIDLLVPANAFSQAGRVIVEAGYHLPSTCSSVWWRVFLGEQHYLCGDGVAIDLHHRAQQPGCPSPRSTRALLDNRASVTVGSNRIPVLSWQSACLVSCMNLVKGLIHLEPTGAHACDIAATLATRTESEIATLVETARRLGLCGTLRAGLRAAHVLLGVQTPATGGETALPFVTDEDLTTMILRPKDMSHLLPSRTRMLWSLCDSPWSFGRELAWKIGAERARVVFGRK